MLLDEYIRQLQQMQQLLQSAERPEDRNPDCGTHEPECGYFLSFEKIQISTDQPDGAPGGKLTVVSQ